MMEAKSFRIMPSLREGRHLLFGDKTTSRLPERVVKLVAAKDRESERLLCLVQFGLAATLGILYLVTPRPKDAGMMFLAPVPIALLAYTLFIWGRLLLVRRGPLPVWGVLVSIAADIALLFGLIWSFHISYGQPPAFTLKVPTFVYIYVFVAIRALRFDYRFVLAAGVMAALGWGALTFITIWVSEPGTVTRNFTEYILGNRILIGAEFDKIFALLVLTGILALVARRAEQTLVAAVSQEAAVREISRFLSRGVADQISQSDQIVEAGQAVERQAAIMFLDIRGFTGFSMKHPPAEVVAMLTGFHARVVPVIRANGGVVDKFLGDGVMATFGAVMASKTAAADALRALDQIIDETEAWKGTLQALDIDEPLRVNGAVAAGTVVFAAVGDENRLEYTVIGEAVNLAAKLEKHNKIAGSLALVPQATFALAKSQGFLPKHDFSERPQSQVAGVTGTIDLISFALHRPL